MVSAQARVWPTARYVQSAMPRRHPRRRVATSRACPLPASAPNHTGAYDFVLDGRANAQFLKYLTVIDECTRECLSLERLRTRAAARAVIET